MVKMSNTVYDFTRFQERIFPEWIQLFVSGPEIGEYSYKINGPTSCYGTTDMLISRYIIDELNLSDDEKDSWASGFMYLKKAVKEQHMFREWQYLL